MAVLDILRRHLGVVRDVNGHLTWPVVITQWVGPIVVGVWVWLEDLRMGTSVAAAVLTIAGLFAAFSFSISVQMMSRAASLADAQPERSKEVSRSAEVAEMIAGSGAYASLLSLVTTALALGVAVVENGWGARLLVAVTAAALAHLAATFAVIVVRLFAVTSAHLRAARTGTSRPGGSRAA